MRFTSLNPLWKAAPVPTEEDAGLAPETVWILYAFFWVIPRRFNFICRRFGTLFHLHRWVGMKNDWDLVRKFSSQNFSPINTPTFSTPVILHTYPPMKMERECSETSAYNTQTPGNYQKKAYNIQNTMKV